MAIGIFGGTFNPVHWGHVRTASEIFNKLKLDKMLLVPCGLPPHREQPEESSADRLVMLNLALKEFPELSVDDREIKREGPSYSVETLESFHQEMPGKSFVLCIGADAFVQLHTWHRWQELFRLTHIVVAHRPGWSLDTIWDLLTDELKHELDGRFTEDYSLLLQEKTGKLITVNVTDIDISSSDIRHRIATRQSISGLVPVAVEAYIKSHELYMD